jgi:hypothetical protein
VEELNGVTCGLVNEVQVLEVRTDGNDTLFAETFFALAVSGTELQVPLRAYLFEYSPQL